LGDVDVEVEVFDDLGDRGGAASFFFGSTALDGVTLSVLFHLILSIATRSPLDRLIDGMFFGTYPRNGLDRFWDRFFQQCRKPRRKK
jgi:hypothetical protein